MFSECCRMRSQSGRRIAAFAAAVFASLGLSMMAAAQAIAPVPPVMPEVLRAGWTPAGLTADKASRPPVACSLPPHTNVPRSLWNANLWPGGIVPFEFDANTTAGDQAAMLGAMSEIQKACGVRFVARSGEANFLHIQDSTGNNSQIGMVGGGQIVNIFNWDFRFIMAHELIHALGVFHEQSRSDRASFVTINLGNIQDAFEGNFDIEAGATPVGTFDFDSVMLYDKCSFSTCCAAGFTCNCPANCLAIEPLPAFIDQLDLMGQRDHLSDGDIAGLVSRYGDPLSACCASNGSCSITTEADCTGAWLQSSVCDPNPCTGACCSAAGTCTLTSQDGCSGVNGIFRGYAVACGANTCAGACCSQPGSCSIVSAISCSASGGIFRGTDVACAANSCPGACCSQAGDCSVTTATLCSGSTGVFRGTDTACLPLTCPGACCAQTGECTFTSASLCSAGGGSYRGLDLPCGPVTCPGACCLLDRSCIITGVGICTGQRGEYLGLDTTCDGAPCCCRPWDNGYADGRGGQLSQIGATDDWRPLVGVSFDDFWLCEGQVHCIDRASGVVASNSITPKFIVVILPDCDGLPDITRPLAVAGLDGTRFDVDQDDVPFILGRIEQDVHRGPDAEGYSLINVTAVFDDKKLVLKGGAYWISIFGVSATVNPLDEFFWQTSGNLVVKGRPGVFFDGDTFRTSDELCCGCTDYNFCVEGESCKILLDNGPPVAIFGTVHPTAIPSLQNGTNTATRSRAADKVVFPPCGDFDICYIEGWMWTNCDRISLQFFRNDCKCPDDDDSGSVFIDADCVMSSAITAQDNSGVTLTLKKAQFFFQQSRVPTILGGGPLRGRNLWVSLVGQGDNRQNARAYFAFGNRCDRECDDGFGCFRAAPFATTSWRSNDFPGTSVRGDDHALLVAVREADVPLAIGTQPPPPICPADFDRSGQLGSQDLFDFLAAWFTGCP